jgi:hypothetical protein
MNWKYVILLLLKYILLPLGSWNRGFCFHTLGKDESICTITFCHALIPPTLWTAFSSLVAPSLKTDIMLIPDISIYQQTRRNFL